MPPQSPAGDPSARLLCRHRTSVLTRILAALALLICATLALPAFAQDTPEEERSWFWASSEINSLRPTGSIRLNGIEGCCPPMPGSARSPLPTGRASGCGSSTHRSDWNRSALFGGTLQINTLAARREIEVLRQAAGGGRSAPGPGSFQITGAAADDHRRCAAGAARQFWRRCLRPSVRAGINGRIRLEGGSLDRALQITRLDGPGGQFTLGVVYAKETDLFDLNRRLRSRRMASSPICSVSRGARRSNWRWPAKARSARSIFASRSMQPASGCSPARRGCRQQAEGLAFAANLGGPIAQLVPAQFRPFSAPRRRSPPMGWSRP